VVCVPCLSSPVNCTALGEHLCSVDGNCAAFGTYQSMIQLHGCVSFVSITCCRELRVHSSARPLRAISQVAKHGLGNFHTKHLQRGVMYSMKVQLTSMKAPVSRIRIPGLSTTASCRVLCLCFRSSNAASVTPTSEALMLGPAKAPFMVGTRRSLNHHGEHVLWLLGSCGAIRQCFHGSLVLSHPGLRIWSCHYEYITVYRIWVWFCLM